MSTLLETLPMLDPALEPIREKVLAGQRLSREDGRALFASRDIFTIGQMANLVRERMHGRRTYFNINRHINYSNYCVLRCKFCSFYRAYPTGKSDEATERRSDGVAEVGASPARHTATLNIVGGALPLLTQEQLAAGNGGSGTNSHAPGGWAGAAYELTIEQIVETCENAVREGATEVHIVGGLHPKLPFSFYTDMCRAIKAACPKLCIKAFTAIEIVHFTRISKPRLSIEEVLIALREAGLDTLPGGGAEIFDDRVHDEAYKNKVGEKHWFDVHDTAHRLGIPTNATMLYGHIEGADERIEHLIKLRDQQDKSKARMQNAECRMQNAGAGSSGPRSLSGAAGSEDPSAFCIPHSALPSASTSPAAFQCLIPLSFIPDGSELGHLPGPTGLDDLKTLAISRLMLDNFDHIKAFWIMQSPKLSQVALNWGVDDFDGTVVWYDITKREGRGTNHQELSVDQIRRLIREAGCEPVERDSFYRVVTR